jgi:putative ATP-binding cassette transporter
LTVEHFSTEAYAGALTRFGLDRLVAQLDVVGRWDRALSDEEQQCVGLARVLLRTPRWLVIDEVLDVLEQGALGRVVEVFSKELVRTGLIHIGRADTRTRLLTRVLHFRA